MSKHDLSTHFQIRPTFTLVGLDIETLALKSLRPIIFQIGLVVVRIHRDHDVLEEVTSFDLRPSIAEQAVVGRSTDKDTIRFHDKIRAECGLCVEDYYGLDRQRDVRESLLKVEEVCKEADAVCINHPEFDAPRLASLATDFQFSRELWHFRKTFDVSLPYRFVSAVVGEYPGLNKARHDAVLDATWNVRVAAEFLTL
jgi:hypothetical protein